MMQSPDTLLFNSQLLGTYSLDQVALIPVVLAKFQPSGWTAVVMPCVATSHFKKSVSLLLWYTSYFHTLQLLPNQPIHFSCQPITGLTAPVYSCINSLAIQTPMTLWSSARSQSNRDLNCTAVKGEKLTKFTMKNQQILYPFQSLSPDLIRVKLKSPCPHHEGITREQWCSSTCS
jgi:hypothetical protein